MDAPPGTLRKKTGFRLRCPVTLPKLNSLWKTKQGKTQRTKTEKERQDCSLEKDRKMPQKIPAEAF